MISMFNSIFPSSAVSTQDGSKGRPTGDSDRGDPLQPLPSAISSFPLQLVDMLTSTLRQYMPNVRDKTTRESLLTQVLYCAGSLGRLGGDFSMLLATLDEPNEHRREGDEAPAQDGGQREADDEAPSAIPEWIEVMQKHRVLAGRLELLASGVGSGPNLGSVHAGRDNST
jgi:hypothetical protein